jgi:hypothetical protein
MPSTSGIVSSSIENTITWSLIDCTVYGNSYSASDTHNTPSLRAVTQLNSRFGWKSFTNNAVNGYKAQDMNIEAQSNRSRKWVPGSNKGLVILFGPTLNCMADADTTQTRTAASEALRSFCARTLASTVAEQTTFTFGGTWASTASASADHSGGSLGLTTTTGATFSISLPAGRHYVTVVATNGATITAGQWDFTFNGSPVGSLDCNAKHVNSVVRPGAADVQPIVFPYTATTSGTLVGTFNKLGRGGTVYGFVDNVLTVPDVPQTRIVIVKPNETTNAGYTGKPTLLTDLSDMCDTIAAEFPAGRVTTVNPEPTWNPATMLGADNLHPNDTGMTYLADTVETAIRGIAGPF